MLKINRLNANGEKVETIIDETKIDGTSERKVAKTVLYDANHNKVGEQENPSVYDIYFNNGRQILVDKDTYDKLVKKLNVTTL